MTKHDDNVYGDDNDNKLSEEEEEVEKFLISLQLFLVVVVTCKLQMLSTDSSAFLQPSCKQTNENLCDKHSDDGHFAA